MTWSRGRGKVSWRKIFKTINENSSQLREVLEGQKKNLDVNNRRLQVFELYLYIKKKKKVKVRADGCQ